MKFRGNHLTRIDDKGRLKLPAELKRVVDEEHGPQFYITSKDGKRAEIYPMKEWEKIEARLEKLGPTHPVRKRFLDITNYYGQTVEMDQQGRLLLPQVIRDAAGLTEDVVLLGATDYLEVANRPAFKAMVDAHPLTDEELTFFSQVQV